MLIVVALPLFPAIKWLEKDYDFGKFHETDGPTTGTSRFVNLGPETISIFHVRPSCGCTSADYTKDPIAPGDTAVIQYTYDPVDRPGSFDKTVRVTLSDGVNQIIKIKGTIIGTPESLAYRYPVNAGNLLLSDAFIDLGEMKKGRTPMKFLRGYSVAKDSVAPSISTDSPAISLKQDTTIIGEGDVVTFTVNFDSRIMQEYGPFEIPLTVNMPVASNAGATLDPSDQTIIMLRGIILPDPYPFILEQKGKSPAIELNSTTIDLGEIGDAKFDTWFTVTNTGKSDLEILRVYSACKAFNFGELPKPVKPGKTASVKITVDPQLLNAGPQQQSVEILTNDPNRTHLSIPVALFYRE